jgi:hypothetical protein
MKLKNATVVTSKFLQLRDRLNNDIALNRSARQGWNGPSNDEIAYNVSRIQKAFGELCELLHEMAMDES